MTLCGEEEGAVRPVLQIAMPRSPRIYAPGGTMHVVARCNNREFSFPASEESEIGGRASQPATAPNPLTELFSQSYCSHVGIQDIMKAPVKTGRVQEVDVTVEFHHDD